MIISKIKQSITVVILLFVLADWGTTAATGPEVYLTIGRKQASATTILIAPFLKEGIWRSIELGPELTSILRDDLSATGHFFIPDDRDLFHELSSGEADGQIDFHRWREAGGKILVKNRYSAEGEKLVLDVRVYDLASQYRIMGTVFEGRLEDKRSLVHHAADEIVYRLTGRRGVAGTKVAYISETSGVKEIMIMDYDGYNPTSLTILNSLSLFPAWSSGGDFLAFTSYKNRNPDLFVVGSDGTGLQRLLDLPGLNTHPAWSPDGRHLAITLSKDGNPEIYLYELRQKRLRRLTFNLGNDTSPSWAPNGRQLVFTSDRSGSPQLYVMDADGSNLRRLTFRGTFNDLADWSPVGETIAYCSRRGRRFRIYLINSDGSQDRELLSGPDDYESPSWSPDGRHLVFTVNSEKSRQVYRLDLGTGKVLSLTRIGKDNSSPSWSPYRKGW